MVLEKTLESPLDSKEIKPVHPKGNQSWIFIGRTDAEAETPILWPLDVKNWPIGERDDRGRDGGWHHRLNGHEFESTLGVGEGQGGLACCSPWGHKESDTTEQLNWTESENDNLSLSFNFCIIFFHFSQKKKLLGTAGILPQATNENSQIILLAFYSVNMALKIEHYKGNPV